MSDGVSSAHIVVQELGAVKPRSKVAFCFNTNTWTLLVSNSGHNKILRDRDAADFDFGGWCDLRSGRIWPTNGTVSNVPKGWRDAIQGALERHFREFLSWML